MLIAHITEAEGPALVTVLLIGAAVGVVLASVALGVWAHRRRR